MVLNGACLTLQGDMTAPFQDPFGWVKYAAASGPCMHHRGAGCLQVSLSTSSAAFATTMTLEAVADTPKYMVINSTCLLPQGCGSIKHGYKESYMFQDDFSWSVDDSVFESL